MKKERKSGTSIKATLHLKEKQYITPHFIRAIFTSEDLSRFS
jgi:NADPH-dependent ferric siderophore reductase